MRTVLLVAFHFPPLTGSSGIQRTLRFAQYLPEFGWKPVVLTATANAYEQTDAATLSQIPAGCEVVRVPAFDTARHLSLAGRYPGALAVPDRWATWSWLAGTMGERTCRRHAAQLIWSTYPIATAHRIGASLARRTGLPWVADFRDPMAQDGYPADPVRWQAYKRIEEEAARAAARLVFVTPSAVQMYRERYPGTPAERFELIENGYDESVFAALGRLQPPPRDGRALVMLHSGIVYPSERDPTALIEALGALRNSGAIRPGQFVIRFRAAVHDELLRRLARAHGVDDFVELAPAIPYQAALAEMMQADALLVMQGANCNQQIPAKLYEYLRAARPILGLADPQGDTGRRLLEMGYRSVAALESGEQVRRTLSAFVREMLGERSGDAARPESAARFDRRALTGAFAALLDRVAGERAQRTPGEIAAT